MMIEFENVQNIVIILLKVWILKLH